MKFILNKDILTIEDREKPNSGSVNYYEIPVEYDESWDNLTITAVLVEEDAETGKSISVINNNVFIDNNLDGKYQIGFMGYTIENEEKTYQISTNLKPVIFNRGAGQITTQEQTLPTPTEWEIYIAQIQEMLEGITMIPSGGTTGQALVKKSNTDYDYEWKTVQGGGSGGTTNHAELDNLDYEHSGHTGFQPAGNYVEDNNYIHTDNNFTDTYKSNVEANTTAKHTHSNKSVLDDISSTDITNWNNKSNFSGSYEDLSNKPTIPSEVTETTVSNWGFTKNTGTYSKPSGGIPKTDLSSNVQTSLEKADTALQSYTEQYTGTITGVTMNGVSKGTSGVVDLGTVITSHQDLSNYELKPTIVSSSETTASITPQNNTIYQFGELTSLTITNPPATGAYSIIFTSGSTATTTVIPNTMLGLEDFAAEANTVYEINVFNNRAVVGSWAVSV